MSEFIQVTRAYDEKKVMVNMANVMTLTPMNPEHRGTILAFDNKGSLEVTETVAEIIAKIDGVIDYHQPAA